MCMDLDAQSVIIAVNLDSSGILTVDVPKKAVNAFSSCDHEDVLFVLANGEEIPHDEIRNTEKIRSLYIPFPSNSEEIEIIGNFVSQMPESRSDCGYLYENHRINITPLQQTKIGISAQNVICEENLELVIKNNAIPACVKLESVPRLIERGWLEKSYQEFSKNNSDYTIKEMPVLTDTNNHAVDYSVDEKGKIDLDKVPIPIDERYGGIDYTKLGHLVAEFDLKKQLSQKNIQYSEQDYLFIDGFSLESYPPRSGYCAFVKSLDGKEYWYGGWFHNDTLSTSKLHDHNPNPCRPNEQSCACNLQKKLTINNLDTLSFFDSSEEESVGKIIQNYLDSSNISNISNQFIIGKYNLDKGLFVTPFCGKFVGPSNIKEFEGSIEFGKVTEFALKSTQELCAINDNAPVYEFVSP